MKIEDKKALINQIVDFNANKTEKKNVAQTANKNDSDVKVKISSEGSKLSEYNQIVKDIKKERTEKVQNLKNSINEGTYKIDSEKIADKILKDALGDIIKEE